MSVQESPDAPPGNPPRKLFRPDAIAQSEHQHQDEGHLLTVFPRWMRLSYWVILLSVVTLFLFLIFGTYNEYATGPALIWFKDRQDITVRKSGTVKTIEVFPGQKVRAGDILMKLNDSQEAVDLQELQQEFDMRLTDYLINQQNEEARSTLTALRARRDRAAVLLEARLIKASEDSIVTDLRVRLGQHVAEGESVMSLVHGEAKCSALIMLPGHYRPQLHKGMPLRMEMNGYRYAYHQFVVDEVAEHVIGPNEVQRYLGSEFRDSVAIQGPIVFVWAHPREKFFKVQEQTYSYHHGMIGKADVPMKKEKIIVALLPALRMLF